MQRPDIHYGCVHLEPSGEDLYPIAGFQGGRSGRTCGWWHIQECKVSLLSSLFPPLSLSHLLIGHNTPLPFRRHPLRHRSISFHAHARLDTRALRPLRIAFQLEGIRVVAISMARAIRASIHVFLVAAILMYIFSVLGVDLMAGLFDGCYSGSYTGWNILNPYYVVADNQSINRTWWDISRL